MERCNRVCGDRQYPEYGTTAHRCWRWIPLLRPWRVSSCRSDDCCCTKAGTRVDEDLARWLEGFAGVTIARSLGPECSCWTSATTTSHGQEAGQRLPQRLW